MTATRRPEFRSATRPGNGNRHSPRRPCSPRHLACRPATSRFMLVTFRHECPPLASGSMGSRQRPRSGDSPAWHSAKETGFGCRRKSCGETRDPISRELRQVRRGRARHRQVRAPTSLSRTLRHGCPSSWMAGRGRRVVPRCGMCGPAGSTPASLQGGFRSAIDLRGGCRENRETLRVRVMPRPFPAPAKRHVANGDKEAERCVPRIGRLCCDRLYNLW